MIQRITFFLGVWAFSSGSFAQNPGLLISEFNQNPAGTDSPFEYVELLAVDDIDFALTPYTLIVCNNGTATTSGWVSGGSLSYAFEITSGTVAVGDVVYVGGTSMAPTGIQLRVIDTGTTGGDGGIGNFNTGGVVGNGGGNSDGIAVFNLPVSAITSTTVPTDAVFYGDGTGPGHGATIVNAGVDGYELPVNDLYAGGKLQAGSFLALDADLTVASGNFDLTTNSFSVGRTFAAGAISSGVSGITLISSPPPVLGFVGTHATYDEAAGTITVNISIAASNAFESSADIVVRDGSSADETIDFTLGSSSVLFPPSSTADGLVTIDLNEDLIAEESEYILLSLENFSNGEASTSNNYIVYITDNDRILPTPTNELKFELLTSYSNGPEGSNSAEIVAYDSSNYRLFIANSIGNNLDVVDFSDPSAPIAITSVNLDSIGGINSVAAYNGVVAVALQNLDPQQNGYVSFFDENGVWLNRVDAGAMPDMLTFTKDGSQLLVACEGEPSSDYLTDPEGMVAIIDMVYPVTTMSGADVTLVNFNTLDGTESALRAQGIRIFGPGASASMDFEPEYVTVLEDGITAYVTLQENNALAIVDLVSKSLVDVVALGTIDHNVFGYGMDVSNVTSAINIANFPVKGLFLPDAIASLNIAGTNYLFTANEGDTRAYAGFSEETRIKDVTLDPTAFPDAGNMQSQYLLGRLIMTNTLGDDLLDGDFDELYTIGTRSFSIWDESGTLIFDSGDLMEQILANHPDFQDLFNASNSAGAVSVKNRSDDKGPEVEGVATATVDGNHFVFVSLERVGGVFIFNVNDPVNPQYVGYQNNRDAVTNGPDRGAEGLIFIEAAGSPNGNSLLLLANEISSTVTVFQLNSCADLSDLEVTTESGNTAFCDYDSLLISATTTATLDYQWYFEGTALAGETSNETYAMSGGFYQLYFENPAELCSGKTDSLVIAELLSPLPTVVVNNAVLSTQVFDSYQWYFEGAALTGETNQEYTPTQDGDYSVVVTNASGCEGAAAYTVNFTEIQTAEMPSILVYPNPASAFVYVRIEDPTGVYIRLTDMKGALVFERNGQNQTSLIEIPVDSLETGLYVLTITTDQRTHSQMITVQD